MSTETMESAAEMLAVEMATAGYADPDSTEQWRAPIESARSILEGLERRGYRLTHVLDPLEGLRTFFDAPADVRPR